MWFVLCTCFVTLRARAQHNKTHTYNNKSLVMKSSALTSTLVSSRRRVETSTHCRRDDNASLAPRDACSGRRGQWRANHYYTCTVKTKQPIHTHIHMHICFVCLFFVFVREVSPPVDRTGGCLRFTPIPYQPTVSRSCVTLFSKCFSPFGRPTCVLSVPCEYSSCLLP